MYSPTLINLFSAALVSSLLLSSCGGGSEQKLNNPSGEILNAASMKYLAIEDAKNIEKDWRKDNNLIVHWIGEPDDMHPTNGTSAARSEISFYTQVTLLRFDFHTQGFSPQLAKSTPKISADALEYTYELREDLTWDDGSPITAEDFLFTVKANKCPLTNNPHAKPYLNNIKDVVIDPVAKNVVIVKMKDKYIQNTWMWLDYPILQRNYFDPSNVLSKYTLAQFDDEKFKADANADLKAWGAFFNDPKFSHDPQYIVGAGSYKMEKWDAGQSITLIKKQKHWTTGKEDLYCNAFPDKIIFKINKDPNSTRLDFKNQVFDATAYMDTRSLEELHTDSNFRRNYNSRFMDTYYYSYVALNMKPDGIKHKKLFTDQKVRRAMAYLFPVDNINKVINGGRNKRMVSCVSPLKSDFNTDLKPIPYDVEAAKKLLAEAGWKDTDGDQILDKMIDGEKVKFEFNLQYMTTAKTWEDMAHLASEAMIKAGVKANLLPLEFNVHRQTATSHDFDMGLFSWTTPGIPEDFSQVWGSTSWSHNGSNYVGFGNAETDALIAQINQTVNDSLRAPLSKKFQQMVYDDQPYIFLFSSLRRVAVHKRFGHQELYFEHPGMLFNNMKLLNGVMNTASSQP